MNYRTDCPDGVNPSAWSKLLEIYGGRVPEELTGVAFEGVSWWPGGSWRGSSYWTLPDGVYWSIWGGGGGFGSGSYMYFDLYASISGTGSWGPHPVARHARIYQVQYPTDQDPYQEVMVWMLGAYRLYAVPEIPGDIALENRLQAVKDSYGQYSNFVSRDCSGYFDYYTE